MDAEDHAVDRPSDVPGQRTWFDRLADRATGFAAKAGFFLACAGFILVWAVVGLFVGHSHDWNDVLAVPAAAVTLVIVALLQNDQRRSEQAVQRKLNALSGALAELAERSGIDGRFVDELRAAVGLEHRESTAMTDERAEKIAETRS